DPGAGEGIPAPGAGVRAATGRRRAAAVQVLALLRPGATGGTLPGAPARSAEALEAVAGGPGGAHALRRLHPGARGDAQGHPHPACAVDAGGFQRPAPGPADPAARPARPPARHPRARAGARPAGAAGQAAAGNLWPVASAATPRALSGPTDGRWPGGWRRSPAPALTQRTW